MIMLSIEYTHILVYEEASILGLENVQSWTL